MSQIQTTLFGNLNSEPLAAPIAKASPAIAAARAEGERRKREGMALAAASNEHLLARAREYAHDIQCGVEPHADGKRAANGLCTADDVAAAWERDNDRREREGLPRVPWIGNAAGHIFQERDGEERLWEQVGMVKSCRPHAHRNLLRQWKWKHLT